MSEYNSKNSVAVTYKYNIVIESVTHKRIGRYKIAKTREMSHLSYSLYTNVVYMESEQKVGHFLLCFLNNVYVNACSIVLFCSISFVKLHIQYT